MPPAAPSPAGTHCPRCRTARICSARRRGARSPAPSPSSRSAPGSRPPRTRPWARRAAGTSATRWGKRRRRCSSGRPPARTCGRDTGDTVTGCGRAPPPRPLPSDDSPSQSGSRAVPARPPAVPSAVPSPRGAGAALTAGPGRKRRAAATPWPPPSFRHRERGVRGRGRAAGGGARAGPRLGAVGRGGGCRVLIGRLREGGPAPPRPQAAMAAPPLPVAEPLPGDPAEPNPFSFREFVRSKSRGGDGAGGDTQVRPCAVARPASVPSRRPLQPRCPLRRRLGPGPSCPLCPRCPQSRGTRRRRMMKRRNGVRATSRWPWSRLTWAARPRSEPPRGRTVSAPGSRATSR